MIVEAHVTINASKAAVWAATTDIEHFTQVLSGVEKIEVVHKPATSLVGLRWKETRNLFGKEATIEKWITEAKENDYYTTRAEDSGFVFITTNRISGSDGSVTLSGIHETQPQGFAAKLKSLPMVFFKGVIKKAILQDLNDIMKAAHAASRVTSLGIGGLVAAGLDPSGEYLLIISHSGRGVFSTATWVRVARDTQLAYPEDGVGRGIGPLYGLSIPVLELDYDTDRLQFFSPDGRLSFEYEEGTLIVTSLA